VTSYSKYARALTVESLCPSDFCVVNILGH
jgi:hypothetical protein